jgi:hypothetical protein
MFEEKVEIETCLSEHFSKIGTDINIAPGRMEHMPPDFLSITDLGLQ